MLRRIAQFALCIVTCVAAAALDQLPSSLSSGTKPTSAVTHKSDSLDVGEDGDLDPDSFSGAPKKCDPKCPRSSGCCTCAPAANRRKLNKWGGSCKTCRKKDHAVTVMFPRNTNEQTFGGNSVTNANLGHCAVGFSLMYGQKTPLKLGDCSMDLCKDAQTGSHKTTTGGYSSCTRICRLGGVAPVKRRKRVSGWLSKYGISEARLKSKVAGMSHAICNFHKLTNCAPNAKRSAKGCKDCDNSSCRQLKCSLESCSVTKTVQCYAIVPYGHGMSHMTKWSQDWRNKYTYEKAVTQAQKDECLKVQAPCADIARLC